MRLENKVAVVTGASSGMGKAITTRFVQEGAKVVAVARRIERLEELAESLKGEPGEIEIFSADITSVDKNNEMIDFAVEKFGHLDILVNNAGIMDDMSPVGDMTDEMLDRVMKINGYAPIYAMRKAVLDIGIENMFISPRLFFQDVRVPRRIFCEERIAIAFVIPGKPLSKKKIQY